MEGYRRLNKGEKMKKILVILLIATSLSANAKWVQAGIGLHKIMNLDGAQILDITPFAAIHGWKYPKVVTSISTGENFYRCIGWVPDHQAASPVPDTCWILKPD
jgi:hypothetical protein